MPDTFEEALRKAGERPKAPSFEEALAAHGAGTAVAEPPRARAPVEPLNKVAYVGEEQEVGNAPSAGGSPYTPDLPVTPTRDLTFPEKALVAVAKGMHGAAVGADLGAHAAMGGFDALSGQVTGALRDSGRVLRGGVFRRSKEAERAHAMLHPEEVTEFEKDPAGTVFGKETDTSEANQTARKVGNIGTNVALLLAPLAGGKHAGKAAPEIRPEPRGAHVVESRAKPPSFEEALAAGKAPETAGDRAYWEAFREALPTERGVQPHDALDSARAAGNAAREAVEAGPVIRPEPPAPPEIRPEPTVADDGGGPGLDSYIQAQREPPGDATSIKNRMVNRERVERGLGEMAAPVRQTFGEWTDEALDSFAENPNRGHELTAELTARPRAHNPVEAAELTIHRVNLRKSRAAADADGIEAAERAAKGDPAALDAVADAKARSAAVEVQLAEAEAASHGAGTAAGRDLAARRMEMAQDYSLTAIEQKVRKQGDYKPLSREEIAEVRTLHKRVADAEATIATRDARIAEIEAKRNIGEVVRPRVSRAAPADYGKTNTFVTRERYEAAKAAAREKFSRLSAGFSALDAIPEVIEMGAYHLEAGVRGFASWAKKMTDELGPKVGPHLRAVWNAAHAQLSEKTLGEVSARVSEGRKAGKNIGQMPAEVGKLAELFVRHGITERGKLVDAVHEVLKRVDPSITRRETMDAISGYGRTKALDADPVKVQLRELKGQMQQIGKLEDMAAGKAPLKSGPERQSPADAQRELIRLVNEAKRKGGYGIPDPATQLRSALDATKTRLTYEIADLDRQIGSGKKDIPNRTTLQLDAEATALKVKRDALKQEYDAIFAKPGLTEAQRAERAVQSDIRAVEKSITEYERRVKAGDVFKAKTEPKAVDPRVAALREKRDALRQQVEDLRAAAGPNELRFNAELRSFKKRTEKKIAELTRQAEKGEVPVRETKPRYRDAEAIAQEARLATAKKAVDEMVFRKMLASRTKLQKAAAIPVEAANLSRAIMTSFDVSGVGRQGYLLGASHPAIAGKAMPDMFRAFKSPEYQARSEAQIRMRPTYGIAKRAGLSLTETGDVSLAKMEEAFASRHAEKIPIVAGSQRAYTTYLNRLRMDVFDTMWGNLPPGEGTPKAARAIATYINEASGRASVGPKMANALAGLNSVFFAPRLVLSRFQMLAGHSMWGGTAATRILIAKEYARFLTVTAVVLSLGIAAGAAVERDPRSSDFGKLRFGDTRLDPLAGLSQTTVLVSRLATGETKSTTTGKVRPIRGEGLKFGQSDSADAIGTFLRTKLAPIVGAGVNLLSGKDVVGRPTSIGKEAAGLVTPMTFEDIYKAMKEQGVPVGAAMGILSLFGMSLQTYEDRKKGRK